jgi:hypothetical protein
MNYKGYGKKKAWSVSRHNPSIFTRRYEDFKAWSPGTEVRSTELQINIRLIMRNRLQEIKPFFLRNQFIICHIKN